MKLSTGPVLTGPRTTLSINAGQFPSGSTLPFRKSGNLKIETTTTTTSSSSSCRATNELRRNWKEFQGIKNWEGLLDPLNDGLRSEILRYGEMVDAAYRCFNFDCASPDYATCLYPDCSMLARCGVNGSGAWGCCYDVTKHLHATCGIQFPNWTDRIRPRHRRPSWVSTQSSWIGYVAVCTDEREIRRLGRRDVVIAYRGTVTCLEWLENLRATLACLPADMARNPSGSEPMVQAGFLSLYTSQSCKYESLQASIREEVSRILNKYAGEAVSITVTGHSLGAALAALTAHDITTSFENSPMVTVISFGGPRVGNRSFRRELEKNGTKVLRIVNSDDPITKVPGFVLEERDCEVQEGTGLSEWLHRRVEETQWVYSEIGKELRLSSKDCPHINGGSVATCHDLKTYLHLVDNFVSSNCPLKKTAKRILHTA